MAILFALLIAVTLLIQFPLAPASQSPTQPSDSGLPTPKFNYKDPGIGRTPVVPESVKDSENAMILDDEDDDLYDEILDPSVQSVYFKAMRSILQVRDRLCSICLATVSTQDALPYEYASVTKHVLEREYDFIISVNEYLEQIDHSETDEETSSDEDSASEYFDIEVCNSLVPKEVKRLTATRLRNAKGYLRRHMKKGYDTTVEQTRVKAYERLKNSLNNTPGDLSCDADYEVEVAELVHMLRTHYRIT